MATQERFRFLNMTVLILVTLFSSQILTQAQDLKATENGGQDVIIKPSQASQDLCKSDDSVANLCGACAALPRMVSFPVELCCNDGDVMAVCGDCLTDPSACLLDIVTLQNMISAAVNSDLELDIIEPTDTLPTDYFYYDDDDNYLDNEADQPELEKTKRFGTLYLGKRPRYVSQPTPALSDVIKRDDVMDDVMESDSDVEKRWGTLGLGSGNHRRYARWGSLGIGKRWGSLGIGNGNRRSYYGFGKRWGSLGIGHGQRVRDAPEVDKRWGTLGIGKRWGSLGIGKRWGSLGIGKRWGSLGIGKRWGSLGIGNWKRWGSLGLSSRYRGKRWGTLGIGKRDTPSGADDSYNPDTLEKTKEEEEEEEEENNNNKRWGVLSLGSRIQSGPSPRGKRWGSLGLSNWRKRLGRLRLEEKRWGSLGIGKRNEILTALDDNANYLNTLTDSGSEDKRWGTLSLGKRGDEDAAAAAAAALNIEEGAGPDSSEDKRWGTLGIGKRWGSLGGFGGFKRWSGYIGLGHRNPYYSHRARSIGKRSAGVGEPMEKRSESGLFQDKKNEDGEESDTDTDAKNKKWGSLGIGKKWGSLGIGKKWGSLGIGKKWGSLGIGKKWGSLGIGKKWGSLGIGKKWGSLGIGKKWGTLGLGKKRVNPDIKEKQGSSPQVTTEQMKKDASE